MGIDIVAGALSLRTGREPDWDAVAREIELLEVATLFDRRDIFFPLDYWAHEVAEQGLCETDARIGDDAGLDFGLLRIGREELTLAASVVRAAIESPHPSVLRIEEEAGCSWICVSVDASAPDQDLVWRFQVFAESGLAGVAGFECFEHSRPDVQNLDAFDPDQRRMIQAAELYSFADHLVGRREPQFTGQNPRVWFDAWGAAVRGPRRERDDPETLAWDLFELLLATIELSQALNRISPDPSEPEGDDGVRWEQLSYLSDIPFEIGPVGSAWEVIDSFGSRELMAHHQLEEMDLSGEILETGSSRARQLWIDLTAEILGELVLGIVDLYGISAVRAYADDAPSITRHPDLREFVSAIPAGELGWIHERGIDWEAGREAAREIGRGDVLDALDLLRAIVADDKFSRFTACFDLLDSRLWVVLHGEFHGLDRVLTLLGASGVLDALGLVAWHLPSGWKAD